MINHDRFRYPGQTVGTKRVRPLLVLNRNPNISIIEFYTANAAAPDTVSGSGFPASEFSARSDTPTYSDTRKIIARPQRGFLVASGQKWVFYLFSHRWSNVTFTYNPLAVSMVYLYVKITPIIAEIDWATDPTWNGISGMTLGTPMEFQYMECGEVSGPAGPGYAGNIGQSPTVSSPTYPIGFQLPGEDETIFGFILEVKPVTISGTPLVSRGQLLFNGAGDGRNFVMVI